MKKKRLFSLFSLISSIVIVVALAFPKVSVAQTSSNSAQQTAKEAYSKITSDSKVKKGLDFIKADEENTLKEQIEMTEIPAPSSHESKKAEYFMNKLKELGLKDVHIDEAGNVIGTRPGTGDGPKIALAAHSDIAFPEGTDTTVTEKDGKYYAPGIGDNNRGMAALLSVIRALNEANIQTTGDLVFVSTTLEEAVENGLGGANYFLTNNKDIDGFIAVDVEGYNTIIHGGTGEELYRFTYHGPGGHAEGDFGTPSANNALARAVAEISDLNVPKDPKTIFNVGTIKGGSVFNAISETASMEVDMRSVGKQELADLLANVQKAVQNGADKENKRWGSNAITVDSEVLCSIPGGYQPADSIQVLAASEAVKAIGGKPELSSSGMTDANIGFGLDIPSIAIGIGGTGGNAHSLDEWYDPTNSYLGPQQILLTTIGLAGVDNLTTPLLQLKDNGKQPTFKDVDDNHWAFKEIEFLTDKEIINGYPDGTFKPNQSISRLQAVSMILREKGIKDFSNVPDPGFVDMRPGDDGYKEVAKAVELGMINGKVNENGEKVFEPNATLTRAQMAKILSLSYNLKGNDNIKFTDVPKDHWAYSYIQALAKNKIASGYGDGRFGQDDHLTRAQFAAMMARILDDSFRI